jgi:hypothetical protein
MVMAAIEAAGLSFAKGQERTKFFAVIANYGLLRSSGMPPWSPSVFPQRTIGAIEKLGWEGVIDFYKSNKLRNGHSRPYINYGGAGDSFARVWRMALLFHSVMAISVEERYYPYL